MLKLMSRLMLAYLVCNPQLAWGISWNDLWYNHNQQAKHLLEQNKPEQAINLFSDPQWKATAYYRNKQYQQSYDLFAQDKTANGWYNQGNSLAQLQRYPDAIKAYKQALKLQTNFPQAKYNLELVEKLLKQQQDKQQQDKQQQDKQQQDKQQQDKQQQDKQQQDKQQQDKQQQDKQQQDKQQQDKQQQDKQQQDKQQQDKQQQDKQQQDKQQQDKQQQDKQQQDKQQQDKQQQDKQLAKSIDTKLSNQELQQQLEGALAQVPDDPGGLLRNKFARDYQRQQQGGN
ncbi:MAG: hypothetical protein RLZZ293_301 [Pseudomonadota bacterium]